MKDRRDFLKVFGLTTAVMANVATGEPEIVTQTEVKFPEPMIHAGPAIHLPRNEWWKDSMDVAEEPLYDRLVIEKNAMLTQHTFFNGIGHYSTGLKAISDTNVYQPRKLDAPESWAVKQIGVMFSPRTIPGFRDMVIERYCLELWIGQREYFRAPLVDLFTDDGDDPKAKIRGMKTLELPIVLGNEISFYTSLTGNPLKLNPKFSVWCIMNGLHARGVC